MAPGRAFREHRALPNAYTGHVRKLSPESKDLPEPQSTLEAEDPKAPGSRVFSVCHMRGDTGEEKGVCRFGVGTQDFRGVAPGLHCTLE